MSQKLQFEKVIIAFKLRSTLYIIVTEKCKENKVKKV